MVEHCQCCNSLIDFTLQSTFYIELRSGAVLYMHRNCLFRAIGRPDLIPPPMVKIQTK